MINLYIFNESSRASVYGIGTYIAELRKALRDSDINVYVVNLYAENQKNVAEETQAIRLLYIPSPVIQNTTFDRDKHNKQYYRNVVYLLRLKIVSAENLVFHLNYNQSGPLAVELKKAFDCKVVTVVHYSEWGSVIFDNLNRLRSILYNDISDDFSKKLKNSFEEEKLLYSMTDKVVCLSNYMKEILCLDYEIKATKISVIPNCINDTGKTMTENKTLRKKWKITLIEKIILFAGRMEEIKGMEFLLKAFRKVLSTYPNSRLIIVGEGGFNKYSKESQDFCTKITYTGMLNKAKLYELYCLADVGVIPSLFEPFGYVAVEMMMHELPVVVTSTSGLNEVVDDTCGLKVPIIKYSDKVEIDDGLLAEKIIFLLQNPSEAKMIGENGRKRFLKEYSSEVFHRKMLEFYHSLFS